MQKGNFVDTKGVIGNRKSKDRRYNNRQYNDRRYNDRKTIQ